MSTFILVTTEKTKNVALVDDVVNTTVLNNWSNSYISFNTAGQYEIVEWTTKKIQAIFPRISTAIIYE